VSEHRARIDWNRETDSFAYDDYNRAHEWLFESGQKVRASASPRFLGTDDRVDPEEAFVASLSACHMLTFLAICARKRIAVDRYEDDAVGFLEQNEDNRLAIGRVVLRPRITFANGATPDAKTLSRIHDMSHAECFLANSVHTTITVEPPE